MSTTASIDRERLEAGRKLARSLADPKVRRRFASNNFTTGTPVVLAFTDDAVGDVMASVRKHGCGHPLVVIAVFDPGSGNFDFMNVEPGRAMDADPDASGAAPQSTIGMLLAYVRRQSSGFTFKVANPDLAAAAAGVSVFV